MTTTQIRKAFKTDAEIIPYFFRNNTDSKYKLIIDTGKQALITCESLFNNKNLPSDLLDSIYHNIWNRLDLILEINHNYFNLYYDYLIEMLNYYLQLAEDGELYEVCINIKNLLNQFEKSYK
jgi:hypothetical protein